MSEEAQAGAFGGPADPESPSSRSVPAHEAGAFAVPGHPASGDGPRGVLLRADATNWIQVGTVTSKDGSLAIAVISVDGATQVALVERLPPGDGAMLRLVPVGDHWVLEMSVDGQTWSALGQIAHPRAPGGAFAQAPLPAGWNPLGGETPGPTGLPHRLAKVARSDEEGSATDPTPTPAPAPSVLDAPEINLAPQPLFARITLFHGDHQTFGVPGEGQAWINILGNLSGDVIALYYTLNDGPPVKLSLGPDTRRLQEPGDFNIDIAFGALDGTPADDRVTILAILRDGTAISETVTVAYEAGQIWPADYSIDWSTVTDIQQVVQVVDGAWAFDERGARPVGLGYDRLLVLGDRNWDNYQLSTTVTIHDTDNEDPRGRDGGAFAVGVLWAGHGDDPIPDMQPKSGWHPGAFLAFDDGVTSHSYHDFRETLGTAPLSLEEGRSYNLIVRVEQSGLYDRVYSVKIWEVGAAEPLDWTLRTTEVFSPDEAPATGSIYLNAHYHDVTFGDIDVTEIPGRDIVTGTGGDDRLSAVNPLDALPGQGEVDVFAGLAGADTFVFGDASGAYYDDGVAADPGLGDYGYVHDFAPGKDVIQLNGSARDYALAEDIADLAAGTSIWRLGTGGDADELIGLIAGVHGLDLNGDSFVFV